MSSEPLRPRWCPARLRPGRVCESQVLLSVNRPSLSAWALVSSTGNTVTGWQARLSVILGTQRWQVQPPVRAGRRQPMMFLTSMLLSFPSPSPSMSLRTLKQQHSGWLEQDSSSDSLSRNCGRYLLHSSQASSHNPLLHENSAGRFPWAPRGPETALPCRAHVAAPWQVSVLTCPHPSWAVAFV